MKAIFFSAVLATLTITSCNKASDDGGDSRDNRKITYEITGTFTGKFDVVYSDNINGNTHLTNVTLPWTKEIEYGSDVLTVGIGAQASAMGVANQKAIVKIYSNGSMVKSDSAIAGSLGQMLIPTITYQF